MSGTADRWYVAQHILLPAPEAPAYVKNLNDGSVHPIDREEAQLLSRLIGCRTEDEHVEALLHATRYAATRPDRQALEEHIRSWMARGILRPHTLLQTPVPAAAKGNGKAKATANAVLGLVTAGRPAMAKRWMNEFVPRYRERLAGPVIVVDDSRDPTNSITAGSSDVVVITRNDRRAWAEQIAHRIGSHHVDPAVVAWVLLGNGGDERAPIFGAGAARNSLHLAGTGRTVVSMDDDLRPRYARKKRSDPGDTGYAGLYPTIEVLQNDIEIVADPFGELVAAVGSVVHTETDLHEVPAEIVRTLENESVRVVAARLGVFGISPFSAPLDVVSRPDEFRPGDTDDPETFNLIQRNGLTVRHDAAPPVNGHALSSHFDAIDATRDLPPFFPWGRKEDVCFGALLRESDPSTTVLELPTAVMHDPDNKGLFSDMEIGRYAIDTGTYNLLTLQRFLRPHRRPQSAAPPHRSGGALPGA
ncbi:MAG: hypothetical protein PF508_06980 [Spirochaeta sp.]|jgi:hypothetical protein|nr:hypothetical protein [Spirochaeta sp.]